MATSRIDRRLAAILAADVVGYARLMQRDEQGTLERLKAHRKEFVEPLIAEHGGRIVKLMGDGLLCEFGSAVDAVRCAVLMQKGMAEREANVLEEDKIRFRIGINLGDIIHEDGDVYGDGVNLAARLEQLAEPGGVCIARNIHNQVKSKLAFRFAPMGPQRVKNIAEPVEVWRVVPDGIAVHAKPVGWRLTFKPALAAALALVLVVAAGAGSWWWYERQASPGQPAETALPLPAKPSIAVLPLANLSGDPRWERLAGGITEDIITDLARHPDLFVIARNSTEAYKGKAVDVKQVGKGLGVHYVLEGSLQADAGRVRITAQLIDAATGGHLWAERYDRPEGELFAIQDEVVQKIANTIGAWHGQVARAQLAIARRKPPAGLDAYDFYLLGIEQKHKFTKESEAEAIRLLSRAVELDPGLARAWVGLAMAYVISASYGFSDDSRTAMERVRECTEKALTLDPSDAVALTMMGDIRAARGDLAGAKQEYERALATAPSDAEVLTLLAGSVLTTSDPEWGAALGRQALRLNPMAPSYYYLFLSYAEYLRGAYREAVTLLRQVPQDSPPPLFFLALSHAQLGETQEAQKLAARLETEFPNFTVEGFIRDYPITNPPALAAIRESASKAGLLPAATQ
jgi:TolB-like protein/class 3 adenylate cyclase/Flp pilus assembly protein TadD